MEYKKLFYPYRHITHYNESLYPRTSFRIGGPAEVLITPRTEKQLASIYKLCLAEHIPVRILGAGTNILVSSKGIKGVVIKPQHRYIKEGREGLIVSSAYPLPALINKTIKMGLGGIETLIGIPGTLGGAVMMNAGGKYGQIADVIESVKVITSDGELTRISRTECGFAYRSSNLRNTLISEVTLRLKESDTHRLGERAREIMREKKATQPLNEFSAGCIFKNPDEHRDRQVSAGMLIDRAGLKGRTCGSAQISFKHANFIINRGRAKSSDVIKLIDIIKRAVRRKFGIELALEVEIWQ